MKGNIDVYLKMEKSDNVPLMISRLKEALEASGLEAKVRTGTIENGINFKVRISFAGTAS